MVILAILIAIASGIFLPENWFIIVTGICFVIFITSTVLSYKIKNSDIPIDTAMLYFLFIIYMSIAHGITIMARK